MDCDISPEQDGENDESDKKFKDFCLPIFVESNKIYTLHTFRPWITCVCNAKNKLINGVRDTVQPRWGQKASQKNISKDLYIIAMFD